jgi:hypothetical protein
VVGKLAVLANLQVIAERLRQGETVSFRPTGFSMTPYIRSGDLVTVRPVDPEEELQVSMVVLAKVHGKIYLHYIRGINKKRVLIGSSAALNGWTTRDKIYGILQKVEAV